MRRFTLAGPVPLEHAPPPPPGQWCCPPRRLFRGGRICHARPDTRIDGHPDGHRLPDALADRRPHGHPDSRERRHARPGDAHGFDGSPTPTPTSAGTPTATPSPAPDVAQVVEVAADVELRFAPDGFEIAAGETVRWTWVAGGHNVRADSTPADAEWQGTPGGDDTTYDEGSTYEYTFDVPGEYEYVCIPHESLGMTGSFTVAE